MPTLIYALIDPRDEDIHYVGKTVCTLERRLSRHINDRRGRAYRDRWINKLVAMGLRPSIKLIELVPDGADWSARERWWIQKLREQGAPLTNCMNGGEGDASDSNRRRWAAMSDDERAAWRERFLKIQQHKDMTGYRHTVETREAISTKLIGNQNAKGKTWTLSPETRQRIKDSWEKRRLNQV